MRVYRQALVSFRGHLVPMLQFTLGCLLSALILLEVAQISLRYLFSGGFVWGRDVSTLLLFSIAWLGAPLGWLKARHIAVDLFPGLPTGRRAMRRAVDLVAILFSVMLLVFAARAYEAFSFLELPSLGVAASIKFLPMLAGTVLLGVAALLNLLTGFPGDSTHDG